MLFFPFVHRHSFVINKLSNFHVKSWELKATERHELTQFSQTLRTHKTQSWPFSVVLENMKIKLLDLEPEIPIFSQNSISTEKKNLNFKAININCNLQMFMGVITNNQQIRLMFLHTHEFEGLLINLSSSKKSLILMTVRSSAKEKQNTSANTA